MSLAAWGDGQTWPKGPRGRKINHNQGTLSDQFADQDQQVLAQQILATIGRLALAIAAGLGLSGCCLGGGCYVQPPNSALANWDGLGPPPKRNNAKRVKVRKTIERVASKDDSPSEEELARSEAELAKLKPYSKEWATALDALNRAVDAKLKKKLIICRNCMPPEQADHTGSITPNGVRFALPTPGADR